MLETGAPVAQSATAQPATSTKQESRKLFSMETFKPAVKADVGNEICACGCVCICV
jgi:hypothetical protein